MVKADQKRLWPTAVTEHLGHIIDIAKIGTLACRRTHAESVTCPGFVFCRTCDNAQGVKFIYGNDPTRGNWICGRYSRH